MSEPIPESIPTSSDPRSRRPLKRRALTPTSAQASQLDALFANPDIPIPTSTAPPKKSSTLGPPPEIVANVQGSSAGAGSGEFHVYKASRRREYERVRQMEEQNLAEKAQLEYEERKEEMRRKDEEKTSRNKKRREKAKKRKGGKGEKGDVTMGEGEESDGAGGKENLGKKKLGAAKLPVNRDKEEKDGDEDDTVMKSVEDVGVVIHDDD
ncbi:MAG: hypothetical protein L6R41_000422 [Letrouitia leprolyta]|nr:MAG: hypothetical protein L6R41_000422 [Letrouitia leprolyta]